ncbi:unnamed protein product [Urochloa humidicola]
MDDPKGKGIMESENNDSPPGGARRQPRGRAAPYGREDGNRSAGASGGLPQIRGYSYYPGQNQNAPPRYAAAPMACPVCRYSYFVYDMCVYCACAAAAADDNALAGQPQAPPPIFQDFQDRRCPCCRFFPGRAADHPWRHVCRCKVCRYFHARPCPACASPQAAAVAARMELRRLPPPPPPPPQPQHQQRPLGFDTTRNLAYQSAPTVAWRPERQGQGPPPSSGVAASAGHRRRIQCSPPASPLEHIATPEHDNDWCPACLYNQAPRVSEPRPHVCVCDACIKSDAVVCRVCANF